MTTIINYIPNEFAYDLANVIHVCQTNRNAQPICKSEVFWFDKIRHDNPSLNPNQLINK